MKAKTNSLEKKAQNWCNAVMVTPNFLLIAEDFLIQFCTLLSMTSPDHTGEIFEATVCNSKQQRNDPPAFPGSFQPSLIKKHALF